MVPTRIARRDHHRFWVLVGILLGSGTWIFVDNNEENVKELLF
jgi:hypothetical protein